MRDWSDHLRKTSTTQLLVQPKFCKYKTLTANGKIFGPTKVGVVGQLPPALLYQQATELVQCFLSEISSLFTQHLLSSKFGSFRKWQSCRLGRKVYSALHSNSKRDLLKQNQSFQRWQHKSGKNSMCLYQKTEAKCYFHTTLKHCKYNGMLEFYQLRNIKRQTL